MTSFGIIISIVYCGIIILLRWSSFPGLATIPLNEFGDFFAGVFGPLMLFWLILGYIQQQKELSQNTAALKLQADELKKSVDQHKELVKITREQVAADLEALQFEKQKELEKTLPSFVFISGGYRGVNAKSNHFYDLRIENKGKPAYSVVVTSEPDIGMEARSNVVAKSLLMGGEYYYDWGTQEKHSGPEKLKIIINCKSTEGRPITKIFDLYLNNEYQYSVLNVAGVV